MYIHIGIMTFTAYNCDFHVSFPTVAYNCESHYTCEKLGCETIVEKVVNQLYMYIYIYMYMYTCIYMYDERKSLHHPSFSQLRCVAVFCERESSRQISFHSIPFIHIRMYICVYVYIYICIYIYIYVHTCVYMCLYIYIQLRVP